MHSETIDIQTPDGTADCYLTRPSDDGSHPAVLLMIDAIGLRPRIEEMADRIAADGGSGPSGRALRRAGRDHRLLPGRPAGLDDRRLAR
jgi:carboxymethylenebutenolidase